MAKMTPIKIQLDLSEITGALFAVKRACQQLERAMGEAREACAAIQEQVWELRESLEQADR
jgi:hypothetical protein